MNEDLRVIKTKLAIKTAFLTLLEEKDFEKITIKDILKEGMVGRTTFYRYYLDKYDLVEQLITEISQRYEHTLHLRLATQDKTIVDLLNDLSEEIRDLLLLRQIEAKELEIDRLLKQRLAAVFQSELTNQATMKRPELSANLLAALVLELLISKEKGMFQGEESEIGEIFDDLSQLLQLLRNN